MLRRQRIHKYITTATFVVLTIFTFSCRQDDIYYHFDEIKNGEWAVDDTLRFEIDSTVFELDTPYTITLEVTNNVNYPYRNIWFFIQEDITCDSVFSDFHKEYFLADNTGRWNGSGFGSLYQLSLPLAERIIFKEKRNYHVKIEHGMRDNVLDGIEKVGIKITKRQ